MRISLKYCLILLLISGCSYTRNLQLPTVLTSKDELFLITKGTPFTAVRDAGQVPQQYVVTDDDLIVMRKGNYQELVEKDVKQFLKKSRITKKQMAWGGGLMSLLSIIATVLWNRRKKIKIEGSLKGEA